ncbi:MAG: hypothetical protein ACE5JR_10825 [Gemmatimonadota bacterium]
MRRSSDWKGVILAAAALGLLAMTGCESVTAPESEILRDEFKVTPEQGSDDVAIDDSGRRTRPKGVQE